jgi:hypothetical protein
MPPKKRCQFHSEQQCNQAALRIIGNCPHCRSDFCGTVRLKFGWPDRTIVSDVTDGPCSIGYQSTMRAITLRIVGNKPLTETSSS